MLQEAIEQAKTLVSSLEALQQQLETAGDEAAAAPLSSTDFPGQPAGPGDTISVAADGPDNSLPFKCPACGATYLEQVVCINGHPPEQTLPTADVLAGAAPADAAATPAPPAETQAVIEQATGPAAASPQWPAAQ